MRTQCRRRHAPPSLQDSQRRADRSSRRVAVRMIGAELNSYGVVVKYEQRATHVKEKERKRTDMELWFDRSSVAVDYTVPNTLNHLKQRTPGFKYAPLDRSAIKRQHRVSRLASMQTSRGTKIMNSFPWLQSHLLGWEGWLSSSSEKSLEPKPQQGTLYIYRAYLETPHRHQPDCSTEGELSKTAKGGGYMLNSRPFQ